MANRRRKAEANREFDTLAKDIDAPNRGEAAVKPCFLELATPKLADAVTVCEG